MGMVIYDKIALIGIGLIGSSLARVIRREGLSKHIAISTRSADTLARAQERARAPLFYRSLPAQQKPRR